MAEDLKEAAKNVAEINKLVAQNAELISDSAKMLSDQKISESELAKLIKKVDSYKNTLFIDPKKLGVSEDRVEGLTKNLASFSTTMKKVQTGTIDAESVMSDMEKSLRNWNREQIKGAKILEEKQKKEREEFKEAQKKEKWWHAEKSLDEKLSEITKKYTDKVGEDTSGWRGMLVHSINDKVFEPLANNPIIKMLGGSGIIRILQASVLDSGRKWLSKARETRFDKQRFAITREQYRNLGTDTMGTEGEQRQMERLQQIIESTRDEKTGKIDEDSWAFKSLVELWEKTGARASLEEGLDADMFEKNLAAAFNKDWENITSPALEQTSTLVRQQIDNITDSQNVIKEILEKHNTDKGDLQTISNQQKVSSQLLEELPAKIEKLTRVKNSLLEKANLTGVTDNDALTEIENKLTSFQEEKEKTEQSLKLYEQNKNLAEKNIKLIEEEKSLTKENEKILEKYNDILDKLKSGNLNLISQQNIDELKSISGITETDLSSTAFESGVGLLVKTLTHLLTGSPPVGKVINDLWEGTKKRLKTVGQKERTKQETSYQQQEIPFPETEKIGSDVTDQFGKIGQAAKKLHSGGLLLLQKTIGGIGNVLGNLMTPLKGMGGLVSGGGIRVFLTSIGLGIAGLLGSIAALTPAGIGLGLLGLTGISSQFLILGAALKTAGPGISSILEGLGKVISSVADGVKKGGQAIIDTFTGLSEIGWGGILKGITAITGLGLALKTFGLTSVLAIPALLATGYMFKTLSGLISNIPTSEKLFSTAEGFHELGKGVKSFALNSMALLPTLPIFTALNALPIVGKLIDLRKAELDSNIQSNTGMESVTLRGQQLRQLVNEKPSLGSTGSNEIAVIQDGSDNSTTNINNTFNDAPPNVYDYLFQETLHSLKFT